MSGPGANTVLPYMAPSPPGVPQPAAGAIPPMPSGAGVNNAMLNGRWRAPHRQQIMIYQQPLDLSLAMNQATAARASNPANWAPSARNGQCWTTNAPGGIGMGSSSLQRTSVFPQDYLTAGNQVAGIARNAFDLNSFVQRYSLTPQASLSHFVN